MSSTPSVLQVTAEQLDPLPAFLPLLDPNAEHPTIHTRTFMQVVYDNDLVIDFDWG